jgi:hypothetical protein
VIAGGQSVYAWLEGAVDLHVHCAPSLFPRWGDGVDVATACEAAGMGGVLLKAHHGSTQGMAAVLTRISRTLKVAGGVVLNRYVGGINPAAVEASLRTGAKCVWFPTIDAEGHVRAFGGTGAYPAQRGGQESGAGISVLDDRGHCLPEAQEVLKLAAEHDAMIATGHLTAAEIDALLRAAREAGVGRFLINHASFATPNLNEDAVGAFVERGAMVELTYLDVSPMWQMSTLEETVRLFRRAGADNVVLASDAGQPHNPAPPEALRVFAQSLHERGLPAEDVRRALTENPRRLLGW